MLKRIVVAVVVCAVATAGAQQSAGDPASALARASAAYANLQIEKTVKVLDSLMLRRDQLTHAQLARAHTIYGSAFAMLDDKQKANDHFVDALKIDANVKLDALASTQEIAALDRARLAWFSTLSSDSAAKETKRLGYASLRLGSGTPGSTFYVNGEAVGAITTPAYWLVPAGRPITISIRAAKCATPWDTTMTVDAGQQITIGRRNPKNCP